MKPFEQYEKVPRTAKWVFPFAAGSALLYYLFVRFPSFADWFNLHIAAFLRRCLSFMTVWVPFSVAELLFLFIPFFLVLLIYRIARIYSKSAKTFRTFLVRVGIAICLVGILFVWCFAPGYYGTTLEHKLGLSRTPVATRELYQTALLLVKEVNALSTEFETLDSGATMMPYTIDEMNGKLMEAYENYTVGKETPDHFYSRIKPVMVSQLMSYAHITGIYTFFTGEATLNIDFPDYCLPYTAAHELAHQRGVAREDEANFTAFLVCYSSNDPYLRYSGFLNLYEYIASALYKADPALWREVWRELNDTVKQEEIAYNAFFDRYRENAVATVSQKVNDVYLQSQGAKEGTKSYNLVVDLAVAFYRDRLPAD